MLFDQPINNNFKTYENIRKNATGQGEYYTTVAMPWNNLIFINIKWVNIRVKGKAIKFTACNACNEK